MLDERQYKCIAMKFKGLEVTEIAKTVGISRTTYYKWLKDEEFKAEMCRREQEYISTTKQILYAYGIKAVQGLIYIAETGDSEKVRADAYSKLLDKTVSNATKIDIDNTTDAKDIVTVDVLSKELEDIDNE